MPSSYTRVGGCVTHSVIRAMSEPASVRRARSKSRARKSATSGAPQKKRTPIVRKRTTAEEVYAGALTLLVDAYTDSVMDVHGNVVVSAAGKQQLRVEPLTSVIQGARGQQSHLLLLALAFEEPIMHSIFRYLDGELNLLVFQVSAFAYEIENVAVCDALNSMTIGSCKKFIMDFLQLCCPTGQRSRINANIVTIEGQQFVVLYPEHMWLSAAIYVTVMERIGQSTEREFLAFLEVLRIQYGLSSIGGVFHACLTANGKIPFLPTTLLKLVKEDPAKFNTVLERVATKFGPRINAAIARELILQHDCLVVQDAAESERHIEFAYDY